MKKNRKGKSKAYWERRTNERLLDSLKDADKILNSLESSYKLASKSVVEKIASLYARFAGDNGVDIHKAMELIKGDEYRQWRYAMEEYLDMIEKGDEALVLELNVLAMRSRINRLEAIEAEILANCAVLADRQDRATGEFLAGQLANNYYSNMYDEYKVSTPAVLDLMNRHKVKLSKADIEAVLRLPWSGRNYSKNIWKREFDVGKKISNLVSQNVMAGTSIDKLAIMVNKEFDSDYYHNAKRLIQTETAFVKGQGDLITYEKLGVEMYEFVATLDMKTSSICRSLDKKRFLVSEARPGENYPPMHPYCRSTTISVRDFEEGATRVARGPDGKGYEIPANMTYQEWFDKYVVDKEGDKGYNKVTESGALNDFNDPYRKRRERHAKIYYESVVNRNKTNEIERVAKNSGFSKEELEKVYNHIFINKHNLNGKIKRFDPDYDMAESWKRLFDGKDIQEHDIILIKHELLESTLMEEKNMSYKEAHKIAEKKFNYFKALTDWQKERGDL